MSNYTVLPGDCLATLRTLPAESVHLCVTSPPYFALRSYLPGGHEDKSLEIGTEDTPAAYVARLVEVFREVWRVLRKDGVAFLNLGDSYFSGGQRATSYDTSGKEPEDYRDRDCLCGNLCDVCRVVYRNHKFHNDGLLVAMLTASLSSPNQGHKGFEIAHLPTSDLPHPADRTSFATQDQGIALGHASGRLHASLASMLGESFPQLLDVCLQRGAACECLLCARSLADYAQGFADKLTSLCVPQTFGRELPDRKTHISYNGGTVDSSLHRTMDKACDFCSYLDYTTITHHGQGNLKPKDLIGVPWRVAFALQDDGWWLRSDIIWHKKAPMPESVTDRPTKAHEYIFLLAKSEKYFYDSEAIKESAARAGDVVTFGAAKARNNDMNGGDPRNGHRTDESRQWGRDCLVAAGRNRRSVWTVATQPYSAAHFATFPPALIEPCILAGTSAKGVCPQCGAQWVRVVERERVFGPKDTGTTNKNPHGDHAQSMTRNGNSRAGDITSITTGWQPSCVCNAGSPVPATVLDPFAGSGTTLAVALKHGRAAIGCELNPEYIDLIHQRCAEMSTEPIRVAGKVDDWSDLGLFAEA